jgi:hypothetical protein
LGVVGCVGVVDGGVLAPGAFSVVVERIGLGSFMRLNA